VKSDFVAYACLLTLLDYHMKNEIRLDVCVAMFHVIDLAKFFYFL